MRMLNRKIMGLAWFLALAAAVPAQAIVGGTPTSAFGQVSSGVQVTPNWVITADHVGYVAGSTFSDAFGSSLVAEVWSLPGSYPQDDIKLLRLVDAINAPVLSVNATPLAAGSGYDFAATIATGANQVPRGYAFSSVREFLPMIDPDDDGLLGPVSANYLVTWLDGYGAPYVEGGDSGGGLFMGHTTDSTTPLWGITSAQIYDEDDQGVSTNYRSAFVQLASYRDWIDTTMANDLADGQMVMWVASAVPEPSTAGLLGLGVLGLICRQRRSMQKVAH